MKKSLHLFSFLKRVSQIASLVAWYREEVFFQQYGIWRFWTKLVMWVQISKSFFPHMERLYWGSL